MQGGKRPTKAQQAWQDWQREQGCMICDTSNPAIHHCIGSTGKHNKVEIGQWWTIPLCYDCHQGPDGIHNSGMRFPYETRKAAEKAMFRQSVEEYIYQNDDLPVPDDVVNAIADYHK